MSDNPDVQEREAAVMLSPTEIRQVLDVLANSVWDEAVVTVGDVTIAVARNGATLPGSATTATVPSPAPAPLAPAPAPALAAMPATTTPTPVAVSDSSVAVTSPSIGVFWRAPEPGAAPFVEVGQRVEAGKEMCIVEVMKLMNHVAAPISGTVTAVHVGNGDAVEFGTALFSIAPE